MDFDLIYKALANPVRRQILLWLKTPQQYFAHQAHPLDFGVCAGLIDERVGLSQSTVSTHLATLQKAELIEASGFSSPVTKPRCRLFATTSTASCNGTRRAAAPPA